MATFHDGELSIQERAGVREIAQYGTRGIRDAMPDQHRELFAQLPYFVIGAVDRDRWPWATFLVGPVGFVSTPDATTLAIETVIAADDPIASAIRVGAPIGTLGIQLHTRRRNRANGIVTELGPNGIRIAVLESFGNCPKYIQARSPLATVARDPKPARIEGERLSIDAKELIARTDTLFIASVSRSRGGADVSHRGGKPGFVRVDDRERETVLTIPDFAGNNFFMTLGNLQEHPRAGIVLVDFERGALLSLTGRTETIWDGPELEAFEGAQRLLRFTVRGGALREGSIGLRWSDPQYAPHLARTGSWP